MFKRVAIIIAEYMLLLVVTTAVIFAAEGLLRWHYREVLTSSSGIDYFYNRSYHKFVKEKGTFGIRGKHFDLVGRHALRVIVMGDSFTYGQGVYPYTLRFPEQAADMFGKKYPGLDVEFINVGVCGANLQHYNRNILNFVIKLQPDFVLYQWFINDMEKFHNVMNVPRLISDQKINRFLTENSVLYCLLQRSWTRLNAVFNRQPTYHEHLVEQFADSTSGPSIAAQDGLNKLLNRLDSSNIAHGIVLFPDSSSKQAEYKIGFLHEQVLNVCEKRNVPCLDLREAFSKYDGNIEQLWANIFDHHPSALAHRVAAENIVDFFGGTWRQMALRRQSPRQE